MIRIISSITWILTVSRIHGLPSKNTSQISDTLKDVTSSSAPAYWSAECGDRTYVGSHTLMMDWAQCRDYCTYFPHAGELGHSFTFADILDDDTNECLRHNLNQHYSQGDGYAGNYWAGGYRGEDGQYKWDSGEPFEFHDFISNPGDDPYIHLAPDNNYHWSTNSDQNDRNNGCLCKSKETVEEKRIIESSCPPGWTEMINRCILLLKPEDYPEKGENQNCNCNCDEGVECTEQNCYMDQEARRWCFDHGYTDGLVEWSSRGEFIQLVILKAEHAQMYGSRKMFVGLDKSNCEWDNPDWIFQSTGERWLEASEEDWLKYWKHIGTDHGEKPWSNVVWFDLPAATGRSLTAVLMSNNHQAIQSYGAVPLCQQLK